MAELNFKFYVPQKQNWSPHPYQKEAFSNKPDLCKNEINFQWRVSTLEHCKQVLKSNFYKDSFREILQKSHIPGILSYVKPLKYPNNSQLL